MADVKTLLVYPPFGSIGNIAMAIPALGAWLRAQDQANEVRALDLNLAFLRWLIAPANLATAGRDAETRLADLNARNELSFAETYEFLRRGRPFVQAAPVRERLDCLLESGYPIPHLERLRLLDAAVDLGASRFLPEFVELNLEGLSLVSHIPDLDEYSLASVLATVERSPLVRAYLAEVVAPRLAAEPCDLLGLSVAFPEQFMMALAIARCAKTMRPGTQVVLGGGFITCYLRRLVTDRIFAAVDGIIPDAGEVPLARLVEELSSGQPDLKRVPGLIWRDGGGVRHNPPAPPLPIRDLPTPAYDLLPLDEYPFPRGEGPLPSLTYRLSHGCWWARCAFCRTDLDLVRRHEQPDADFLYRELRAIIAATGIRTFEFTDEAASPEVVEELCRRMLRDGLNLLWWVNTRVDLRWTEERCRLAQQAGCVRMRFGVESAVPRLLDLMRKGTTVELVEDTLRCAKRGGLGVGIYMMVGIPTETEEEALAGFARARAWQDEGLIAHGWYTAFQAHPGAEVTRAPERFGITQLPDPPDPDIGYPAYNIVHSGMTWQRAFQLRKQFNAVLGGKGLPNTLPPVPEKIMLAGRAVTLRYDVQEIVRMVQEAYPEARSYGDWLRTCAATLPPLRARTPASPA